MLVNISKHIYLNNVKACNLYFRETTIPSDHLKMLALHQ